jgi:PAS domain S-box-containing protein
LTTLQKDLLDELSQHTKHLNHYRSNYAIIKNSLAYLSKQTYEHFKNPKSENSEVFLALEYALAQKRIQGEIDYSRLITIIDQSRTPYLFSHVTILTKYQQKIKKHLIFFENTKLYPLLDQSIQLIAKNTAKIQEKERLSTLAFLVSTAFLMLIGYILYVRQARFFKEKLEVQNELKQFILGLNESAIVSKTDLHGKIVYVNDKFVEISGYSREELLGQSHSLIRHPDESSELFSKLWSTIQNREIFHGNIKNITKEGQAYYVDSTIIPLMDRGNKIVEYLAVRYDIIELVLERDKALSAKRSKEQFLSNMSHELRTPLNAIMGFSTILGSKLASQEEKRFVDIITTSSEQLLALINDILDLSKIESGHFRLSPVSFNLHQQIREVLEKLTTLVDDKKLTLSLKSTISKEQLVIADNLRLTQIMTNLLSNAIKFTPEGGEIELEMLYENRVLSVSVKDTGIGISDEAKKRIFNKFEQANNSTTREYGGTGLGLSITKRLVEAMGGELQVRSALGKGSIFSFSLPIEMDSMPKISEPAKKMTLERCFFGNILVAEDNSENQKLMRELLVLLGVDCDIVSDGNEAVAAVKSKQYDLVLMDENMPNCSGIEAMKIIRQTVSSEELPIIALTANVMSDDKERFLREGMDDFIAKPININELKRVLSHYLTSQKD